MTTQAVMGRAVRLLGRHSAAVALLAVTAYGALALPTFLTEMNLTAILYQYSVIGLLALGQLLVILTGGIDLSVGALVALTSVVTGLVTESRGLGPGLLAGVLAATGLGVASGLLVARTRMPPFIVTLGMMGVARGLAMQVANARPVPVRNAALTAFGQSTVAHVPVSALIWVLVAVAIHFLLTRRRLGRYAYAVGSSEESARLSGIDVGLVKVVVYGASAVLAALAGVIWTARLGSGSPIGGAGYELESIAAVVVGGGNLFGGEGGVGGTLAGVLIFGVINSILNLSGVSPFWQGVIKGVLVLAAVVLGQARRAVRAGR